MLFLFNSASRVGYSVGFLKAMFLPKGSVHEFRYDSSEELPYINSSLATDLETSGQLQRVLISFIDRFGNPDYIYHPARFGKFLSARREGQHVVVAVELGEYAHHENPRAFTEVLRLSIPHIRLPRAQGEDRTLGRDGLYAFAETFDVELAGVRQEFDSWHQCMKGLAALKAFTSTSDQYVLFARLSVIQDANEVRVPSLHKSPGVRMSKERVFAFRIEYIFPIQIAKPSSLAVLKVTVGSGVDLLTGGSYAIGMKSGSVDVVAICDASTDRRSVPVSFHFESAQATLAAPSGTISIAVVEGHRRLLLALGSIVLFVAGGILLKDTNASVEFLGMPSTFMGAALQALALYSMFSLTGKKLV